VNILNTNCSDFIKESEGLPIFKNLPSTYGDFHKVKVRIKKKEDNLSKMFNNAFKNMHKSLKQRAIFTNGSSSFISESNNYTPFYIFPINGYRYLYNTKVDSLDEHNETYNKLLENLTSEQALGIITELLNYTYNSANLKEGINSGAEVLFYNIPYYYCVKIDIFEDYSTLLGVINA